LAQTRLNLQGQRSHVSCGVLSDGLSLQALMNQPAVVALDRLDLSFAPHSWAFADERRADIDAHFAARQRERPKLWNGRVLLMSRCVLNGRSLSGSFFETDFASFLAWRDWNCPDETVTNCFAM